jgi:hypothetical protein
VLVVDVEGVLLATEQVGVGIMNALTIPTQAFEG